MRIFQEKAEIISNSGIRTKYYKIIFKNNHIAGVAQPGQFMQIKVSRDGGPLLRRPFSIHKVRSQKSEARSQIEIIYEVVGEGSRILSQRKAGEYLDVIGPLGNGFNPTPNTQHPTPILVAGGMGVAPLTFLAGKLVRSSKSVVHRKPLALIGAKTKREILCAKEFKELGCEVKIATDDGSRGYKGKVTELLKQILRKNAITQERYNAIYACGPRPMLQEISRISRAKKIPAQISLEEHMACGIGACLGCVVNTRDGYQRVCKEGPVFAAEKIIWK